MRLGMCKRVEMLKTDGSKTESTVTFRYVFGNKIYIIN